MAKRVRAGFRVAVSGHRLNQLPESTRPALQKRIKEALEAMERCAREAGAKAPMVLVSALAEGTDRLAAHAALAMQWHLESPLPFLISRYEQDFADAASIDEFQSLLKAADSVAPIDGEALIAAGGEAAAPYAAVGHALLEHAQALVAVWNGAPKRGPGGTAEVIENALAKGLSVVWITPDASAMRVLQQSAGPSKRTFVVKVNALLRERMAVAALPELAQN